MGVFRLSRRVRKAYCVKRKVALVFCVMHLLTEVNLSVDLAAEMFCQTLAMRLYFDDVRLGLMKTFNSQPSTFNYLLRSEDVKDYRGCTFGYGL